MARQATIGADGNYRFSMQIPIRIGWREIVAAIIYFRSKDMDTLPTSRTDAKRLARDLVSRFGSEGVNNIPPNISAARKREILVQAGELFPELQEKRSNK